MGIDYPVERCAVITNDRSLRHERLLPKLSSAEPMDYRGASNNAKGKNVYPPSYPQMNGRNIRRRFASRSFSPLSVNGADVLE